MFFHSFFNFGWIFLRSNSPEWASVRFSVFFDTPDTWGCIKRSEKSFGYLDHCEIQPMKVKPPAQLFRCTAQCLISRILFVLFICLLTCLVICATYIPCFLTLFWIFPNLGSILALQTIKILLRGYFDTPWTQRGVSIVEVSDFYYKF